MSFPREHWTRIYSTNVLERLNREIKRRTDVVQVFPNEDAALRLTGAILLEISDEWAADERRFFQPGLHAQVARPGCRPARADQRALSSNWPSEASRPFMRITPLTETYTVELCNVLL
jgi:putative transposase